MLFIGTTLAIVYQIRYKRTVKVTYDKERDTFRSELLIGASVLVAFIVHERIHGKGFFHYLQEVCLLSDVCTACPSCNQSMLFRAELHPPCSDKSYMTSHILSHADFMDVINLFRGRGDLAAVDVADANRKH